MKLDANIHRVSGHCRKSFQGHVVTGQGQTGTAMEILSTRLLCEPLK